MTRALIDSKYYVPLGNVSSLKRTERGILLNVGEEKFRVDLLLPDVARLKFSQGGRFDENPTFAASFEPPEPPPFELYDGPDEIALESESLRLRISNEARTRSRFAAPGANIPARKKNVPITNSAVGPRATERTSSTCRGRVASLTSS